MTNIEDLARYAVLDPVADAALLTICLNAAKEWFANAGVEERAGSPLYDLGVYMLATHYYEKRGVVAEGSTDTVPMGVQSIVHQLRRG